VPPTHKRSMNTNNGVEKAKANGIQQIINQTDAAIGQMVYALYNLTEEEIKIVEGTNK
jgi:hypothetical protein